MKDYDNIWDAQLDIWHGDVDRLSQQSLFLAAQKSHTPMDYVYLTEDVTAEDLKKYQVIFYPHPVIVNQQRAAILEEYVEAGGCLVLGCRSGYKDMTGKCVMDRLPGLFAKMSGTDIPEYTRVNPDDEPVYIDWDGIRLEAAVFNDQLKPLGAAFTEETARVFLEKLGAASPYADVLELPWECELAVREKDGRKYYFVLNYKKTPVKIQVKEALVDLYTGETVSGQVELEAFGTKVYRG